MGRRNADNERSARRRELVPQCSPKPIPAVLLPFEKQLADTIGISHQEYLDFKQELERNAKPRPAAYDHIPDIRCDPVSIGISLVIGLALTAVSSLLAPKPKALEKEKERRQLKLADVTGPDRYNTTYGFDNVAPVATWATNVPIMFGKFVNKNGAYSGGIVVTPDLVWSRLFSYGNYQIAKLLYAGGQWGAAFPSPPAVYLGTTPLSKFEEHNFALYYRPTQGVNRIRAENLIAGTRGTPSSGDPQNTDDIFLCPTAEAEEDTGFCYTYTPDGDTAFGVYDIVPNGTIQRVNWRVVSLPQRDGKDDPGGRIKGEREKICGDGSREDGMPGVGRSYGRQLGITEYKTPTGNWQEVQERSEIVVDVGYKIKFYITNTEMEKDFADGVNLQDVQNSSVNERARADDLLQVGETINIGRTVWVVRSRSQQLWEISGNLQLIELECIETYGYRFITVNWSRMIDPMASGPLRKVAKPGENLTTTNHIGLASTPLGHMAMPTIRATRACDVMEFGIRSQVWQQYNNLCNFQEVPTTGQLREFDEDEVQIQNGNMNVYAMRSSCFTVKVRKAGLDATGEPYAWQALNTQFVVRGNTPIDQYNYLRVYFPFKEQKYEFRFEPLDGATCIRAFSNTEVFEWLDASRGTPQTVTAETSYGRFVIKYTGHKIAKIKLLTNPEVSSLVKGFNVGEGGRNATQVSVTGFTTSPYDTSHGKGHGWKSEVLGFPQQYPGQTRSRVIYKDLDGGRRIGIEVKATSIFGRQLASKPGYIPELYTNYVWGPPTYTVVQSIGDWSVGDTFDKGYSITSDPATLNNKFLAEAYANGARTVTAIFRVDTVGSGDEVGDGDVEEITRPYESGGQLSDVTYYPGLVNKSNSSGPEHEIVYVNEMIDNMTAPTYGDMNMLGMAVRSSGRLSDLSQLRYWISGGVQVYRTAPDAIVGSGDDDDALFDVPNQFGRSNLFSDLIYYLLTNKDAGAGDIVNEEMIDKESFELTSRFLARNEIFCDTVIQDATNIREYATELAPLMLCNFLIKAGKFAMTPAVPVDSAYRISLQPVPIKAQFTAGNIIEDSFEVDYFEAQERAPFKASATYRQGEVRQLPEELNVFVRYAGDASGGLEGTVPLEQFPMAEWCTQKGQAVLACKYLLALRKHVTHTVKFQTSPDGLNLAPGDYIKVTTEANPFSTAKIGTVNSYGTITSLSPISDGTYEVTTFAAGSDATKNVTMTVQNGKTNDLKNGLFAWGGETTNSSGVYLVEQLTVTDDSLVDVVASSFPVDSDGVSIINKDILQLDNSTTWYVSE